jgi:hypothetical protein
MDSSTSTTHLFQSRVLRMCKCSPSRVWAWLGRTAWGADIRQRDTPRSAVYDSSPCFILLVSVFFMMNTPFSAYICIGLSGMGWFHWDGGASGAENNTQNWCQRLVFPMHTVMSI